MYSAALDGALKPPGWAISRICLNEWMYVGNSPITLWTSISSARDVFFWGGGEGARMGWHFLHVYSLVSGHSQVYDLTQDG